MDSSDMSGMLMDEALISKIPNGMDGAAGLKIAGGTDEILKNIIAERVLGLPQKQELIRVLPLRIYLADLISKF